MWKAYCEKPPDAEINKYLVHNIYWTDFFLVTIDFLESKNIPRKIYEPIMAANLEKLKKLAAVSADSTMPDFTTRCFEQKIY